MALTAHSLASGSSGNSIVIRNNGAAVLIDAGIGIRRLVAALRAAEIEPADLSGILITHEHSDHTSGAVRMARRFGIPLVANAATLTAVSGAGFVPSRVLDVGCETAFGSLVVRSFPVSHDAACPVGYTISSTNASVCSATDTGVLTPELCAEAENADLLILESNHDVELLRAGPYPWFLKHRIMGDRGHLSNEVACELLARLAADGRTRTVWLAHLSKINNTPRLALSTARKLLSSHLGGNIDISVAQRDVPSLHWSHENTRFQLSLFTSGNRE